MIIDRLHAGTFSEPQDHGVTAALRWLLQCELPALSPGRHSIDGESIYALVSEFVSKPAAQGCWEAHRCFIDIHCVIAGQERIGWAPLDSLQAGEYDREKDFCLLHGAGGDFFTLHPGLFAIMFPHDAHMPGLAVTKPGPLRKVVVKVAVSRKKAPTHTETESR